MKALEAEGLVVREAGTHQRPSASAFEFKPSPTSPIYETYKRRSVDSALKGRGEGWRNSSISLASVDRGTQTDDEASQPRDDSPAKSDRQISPVRKETEHINEADDHSHSGSISDVDSQAAIETVTPVVTRARMVSVPKRVPPALPPRNPNRVTSPGDESSSLADGFDQVSLDEKAKSDDEHSPEAANETVGPKPEQSSHPHAGVGDDEFHSMPTTPSESKEPDYSRSHN